MPEPQRTPQTAQLNPAAPKAKKKKEDFDESTITTMMDKIRRERGGVPASASIRAQAIQRLTAQASGPQPANNLDVAGRFAPKVFAKEGGKTEKVKEEEEKRPSIADRIKAQAGGRAETNRAVDDENLVPGRPKVRKGGEVVKAGIGGALKKAVRGAKRTVRKSFSRTPGGGFLNRFARRAGLPNPLAEKQAPVKTDVTTQIDTPPRAEVGPAPIEATPIRTKRTAPNSGALIQNASQRRLSKARSGSIGRSILGFKKGGMRAFKGGLAETSKSRFVKGSSRIYAKKGGSFLGFTKDDLPSAKDLAVMGLTFLGGGAGALLGKNVITAGAGAAFSGAAADEALTKKGSKKTFAAGGGQVGEPLSSESNRREAFVKKRKERKKRAQGGGLTRQEQIGSTIGQ